MAAEHAGHGSLGLFLQAVPVGAQVDFAVAAEQAGWDSVWFPEITFGDAFVPGAATAARTARIAIGTGLVGAWSRSPVTLAMQAATMQLLSGRLQLGIGVQARNYVENWHGRTYESPVDAMRELLTILRPLLAGENVTFEGDVFTVRGFQLQMPPPERPVRIFVGANGVKMLELAGELADGTLGYFNSAAYVRDVVVPAVERGVARAGRTRADIEITAGYPSVVTRDESGVGLARGQVLMFATALESAPSYADSVAAAGFADAARELRARVAAGDAAGALAAIPDEMVDALTLSGSPTNVRRRIDGLRAAGLDGVHLNPCPPGTWFPLYEGHLALVPGPEPDFPAFLEVIRDTIELIGPSGSA
jgi:alkanesulfonate monooxygenase SsuD/methylene tetrahydromethanopterin reductase-like flavin-dependent oxidoreductase (luciferase family)